jgi:hypothetical protein
MKFLGDISVRRVIENLEIVSEFRELKSELKKRAVREAVEEKTFLKGKNYSPSRRSTWDALLQNNPVSCRFPYLKKLASSSPSIEVSEIIANLYHLASKGVHTVAVETVLIDTSHLSEAEVTLFVKLLIFILYYIDIIKYSIMILTLCILYKLMQKVVVAEALCQDWPVPYFIGTNSEYSAYLESIDAGSDDE